MLLDEQIDALARIYHVLDDTLDSKALACHRGCSSCCTRNVTMTTLEGYRIITLLNQTKEMGLLERLSASAGESPFLPEFTINDLARRCAENDAISEKNQPSNREVCPLLLDDTCTIYAARPLACRTMVSTRDCRMTGYARMDSFMLSVSNVFLQFAEHIDPNGLTGNLADVLLYLSNAEKRHPYETGAVIAGASNLLPNHSLTVLMVPPEHRRQMTLILKMLNPAIGEIT